MRFAYSVIAVVFAFVWLSGVIYASSCPEVDLSNSKINTDTEVGLSLVSKWLSKFNISGNYVKERNSILISVPNADQLIVTLVFYKTLCDLIMESDLPLDEKVKMLNEQQEKLFRRIQFGEIVATTKKNSSRSPRYGPPVMLASMDFEPRQYTLSTGWNGGISNISLCNYYLAENNHPEFLREPPFVVTKANKYFVIVSSAPSRDAAIAEMHRLKRKAPQYDFVVYLPYKDNPNYAIMMATWVPYDVARKALELAKRDVKSDAYIWACRREGDGC